MRLSAEQIAIIKEEAERAFGAEVEVRLFGSRVDEGRRGGDIDLWVDTGLGAEEVARAERGFYAALQRRLGEQRIDLVVHRRGTEPRPIDAVALRNGVAL